MRRSLLFAILLPLCVVLSMRVAERYNGQIDMTTQQRHSLSDAATRALDSLPGELVITAYVPELAVQREQITQRLAPYIAHPTDVRVQFIDPVRNPDDAAAVGVQRPGELHLQMADRLQIVRQPTSAAIDAALTRLARRGEHWIVSLQGHGEAIADDSPGGIARFADKIDAQGFRLVTLDPRQLDALPDNTAVLLIASPTDSYDEHVRGLIDGYLERGGNVLWLADTIAPTLPGLHVTLLPGVIVDAAAARYGLDDPDNAIVTPLPSMIEPGVIDHTATGVAAFKRARGLAWRIDDERWRTVAQLDSSPRSWNETDPLTGNVRRDPARDEQPGPLTVGVLLEYDTASRTPGRIALVGATPIDNSQIGRVSNAALAGGLINWLSGNEGLAPSLPAPDLDLHWSPTLGSMLAIGLMAALPLVYALTGVWLRARRKRR